MTYVIRSWTGAFWQGGGWPTWTADLVKAVKFMSKAEANSAAKYIHGCRVISLEDAHLLVLLEVL